MDITPSVSQKTLLIRGYAPGGFRVNEEMREGGIVITANSCAVFDPAGFDAPDGVFFSPYAEIIAAHPVILIGAGAAFPAGAGELRALFARRYGKTPDVMDTGAACRTYNVLAGEERGVAAFLLPV